MHLPAQSPAFYSHPGPRLTVARPFLIFPRCFCVSSLCRCVLDIVAHSTLPTTPGRRASSTSSCRRCCTPSSLSLWAWPWRCCGTRTSLALTASTGSKEDSRCALQSRLCSMPQITVLLFATIDRSWQPPKKPYAVVYRSCLRRFCFSRPRSQVLEMREKSCVFRWFVFARVLYAPRVFVSLRNRGLLSYFLLRPR